MSKKVDEKILLIVLLCVVCIMIVGYTFYNIKKAYDTKSEIAAEQQLSGQYKSELALLNSIKEQESELNNIIAQYAEKIPAEPGEARIIEFFNNITGEAQLLGITFSERTKNSIAVEMPISVKLTSDYFTMVDILRKIIGAGRFYTIKSIDITSSGSPEISYSINLSAYYIATTA